VQPHGSHGAHAGAQFCTAGIATVWVRPRKRPQQPQPVVLAMINMAALKVSNLVMVLFRLAGGIIGEGRFLCGQRSPTRETLAKPWQSGGVSKKFSTTLGTETLHANGARANKTSRCRAAFREHGAAPSRESRAITPAEYFLHYDRMTQAARFLKPARLPATGRMGPSWRAVLEALRRRPSLRLALPG
jgi:hypothetical protein